MIDPDPSSTADRGLYVLLLHLDRARSIRAGRLPVRTFPPGPYAYVGRARKNLRARWTRHLRADKKRFWHIDYLTPHKRIRRVWVRPGYYDECRTIRSLRSMIPDTEIPAPGFGASDCRCPGHIIYLPGTDGLVDLLAESLHFQEVYAND